MGESLFLKPDCKSSQGLALVEETVVCQLELVCSVNPQQITCPAIFALGFNLSWCIS